MVQIIGDATGMVWIMKYTNFARPYSMIETTVRPANPAA